MNDPRWKKIEQAVAIVADIPVDDRHGWLEKFCSGDVEMLNEIESLLASEDDARCFLERSVAGYAARILPKDDGRLIGKRLGVYRIVRELGRGGMGVVYLAQREDGFDQRVALKVVKRGLDTDDILRRFRVERQILASLNHPNIARLYDGGMSDDGLPYFVMEYVDGKPLTEYCNDQNCSIHERLDLFRTVAAAIQYAHQNLVVHRDLKPSNILVTSDGEVKLLDFGVAKLLSHDAADADLTLAQARVMTPEYASPEQVLGQHVTTATDVYSLGIVLFELLTGTRPYKIKDTSPEELSRAICHSDPARPSEAITAANAASTNRNNRDPEAVTSRALKGDLDNIVLMALRKDPSRRYASAEQFSEDVRRYLEKLPVSARPDTVGYRASKFVRRHTAGVIGGALVLLAVISGGVIAAWQAHLANIQRERAERRFNDVRNLSHSLMFEIHDSVKDLEGSTPTRQLIVTRALEYLNSLAQDASEDVSLTRELAAAYVKVGDIQGNPYGANLGDLEGAERSYAQARSLYESLPGTKAFDADTQRGLATLYDRIGEIKLHASDTQGAHDLFERSLEIRGRLFASSPEDLALGREIAVSRMKIGEASQKLGDIAAALEQTREALNAFERLSARDPQNAKAMRDVMITSNKLGYILFVAGDTIGSLESYRKGFEIGKRLAAQDVNNAVAQRDLSIDYNNIARVLLKQGDSIGAEENLLRSLDVARELSSKDPSNELARSDVAYVLVRLGAAQSAAGKFREALETERQALAINEPMYAANPKHTFTLSEIGDSYGHIGETMEKMNNIPGAIESYRHAADLREKMSALDPTDAQYKQSLAESYLTLGRLNAVLSRANTNPKAVGRAESCKWSGQALEIWNELRSRGAVAEADMSKVREAEALVAVCPTT